MAKVKIIGYRVNSVRPGLYDIRVTVRVYPQVIAGEREVRIDGTLKVIFVSDKLGAIIKKIPVTSFGTYTVFLKVRDNRPPGRYNSKIVAELEGYTMILKGMGVVATRSRDEVRFVMAVAYPRRVAPRTPPKGERKYRIPSPPRELKFGYIGTIPRKHPYIM